MSLASLSWTQILHLGSMCLRVPFTELRPNGLGNIDVGLSLTVCRDTVPGPYTCIPRDNVAPLSVSGESQPSSDLYPPDRLHDSHHRRSSLLLPTCQPLSPRPASLHPTHDRSAPNNEKCLDLTYILFEQDNAGVGPIICISCRLRDYLLSGHEWHCRSEL